MLEISLALVVLGILLSAVLSPISLRFELETARKVRYTLEDARSAVYGYAILNRTAQRVAQDSADGNRAYEIPSGRPYLPCPDVTGDGLEDRNSIALALDVAVPLSNATTMTTQGSCVHQKGILPWRTLGLQTQGDPWGRHLTYWVDLAFSSQLIGFDETFRADTADPRLPLNVTHRGEANETRLYASRTERDTTGAIVCSDFFQVSVISGQTGGCPSTPTALTERQLNVLTGVMNTTNDTINVGARIVRAHDADADSDASTGVIEGAVFVIVSHGKNGFGAIRQQNIATTLSLCASPPPSNLNQGDQVNAYYRTGHPFLDTDPAAIFKCVPIVNDLYAENIYVSGPPDNTVQGAPDDVVLWSSPNLLLGELLRSGVLPIPKLPHLPRE